MMLAKPKPEESTSTSPEEQTVEAPTATTNDREAEIARRLALLTGPDELPAPVMESPEVSASDPFSIDADAGADAVEEVEDPVEEVERDLLAPVTVPVPDAEEPIVETPISIPAPEPVPVPLPEPVIAPAPVPVVEQVKPKAEVKPNNKSALLARIMAAQERAKNAQLKQASTAPPQPTSMEFEKEKMMRALNGITSATATADAKQKEEPLPIINTAQKPPPSFDVFEKQMQQMNMQQPLPAPVAVAPPAFSAPPMTMTMAPPPPAFDSIASQVFKQQSASAPSAPTISSADADLLGGDFGGIMPMAPPSVNISAPSFDQVMQQNLLGEHSQSQSGNGAEDVYDFELDESGMKMSPEEKQRMVEEQRAIMEHIERQARDNKASEAAVKADAFASRMTGGSMPSQSQSQSQSQSYAPSTSVDGFSASEIEEQRKILEQIEAAKGSASSSATGTQIQIGDGQKVQLHGQEKTKEAINEGTAQLVLCLNCNNWMQVVGSATLMYCPICSVVTPVVKQDEVMSKEEILQMEADRKMAEMLQAEENAVAGEDVSDYPGNRTAAGAFAASDKTWWGALNDALVGVGIAAPAESSQQSAEINVTRPPGSQRTLHSAVTGEEGSERIGLLGADDYGGDDGRPEARVAQSQPLFSCIVDSVSNTAAAAGSYMMGEDDDEEVHGVDSTSFLSVPNAGRDKNDSEGNYFAIPPNE